MSWVAYRFWQILEICVVCVLWQVSVALLLSPCVCIKCSLTAKPETRCASRPRAFRGGYFFGGINWLRLRHTDCRDFNCPLFPPRKIMRDSYENRRQEPRMLYARDERKLKLRHINKLQKKKKKKNTPTRTCTFFGSGAGNMPVATVRSIITDFGAPDGPCPATGPLATAPLPKSPPRGGRQGGKKKKLTSFTPDSLIAASLL